MPLRYADRYGGLPHMGETTPPPDDHFPKVFSMTSATYQPAGARGGFAKQQPKEEASAPMEDTRGCENDTGDSAGAKATEAAKTKGDSAESDKANAADTAGATVKDEAVINEVAAAEAEERGGSEYEQGCCEAIAIAAVMILFAKAFCNHTTFTYEIYVMGYLMRTLLIRWHA